MKCSTRGRGSWPTGPTPSWSRTPSHRPAYRTIYSNDHAKGEGAIQDALTHVANTAEWLVGPVDRLVANAGHQVLDGVSVEDTVHLLAKHGEVMASYTASA